MNEIEKHLGIRSDTEKFQEKTVQTDKSDLRAAEALYRAYKARQNPTQAILDTIPKIVESITKSIDKKYRFSQKGNKNFKGPNKNGQKRAHRQKNTQNATNSNNRNSQS